MASIQASLEERSIRHQSYICRQDNFLRRKYMNTETPRSLIPTGGVFLTEFTTKMMQQ